MLTHRQTVTGTHRHFEKKTWYYKKPILTMWTTGWKLWPGHWKIFTLFSALFEEARENWQRSYVNQNAIFPIQKNLNCKNWLIARQCGQLTRFLWTLEVSKRFVSFSIVPQHNRFRIISLVFVHWSHRDRQTSLIYRSLINFFSGIDYSFLSSFNSAKFESKVVAKQPSYIELICPKSPSVRQLSSSIASN